MSNWIKVSEGVFKQEVNNPQKTVTMESLIIDRDLYQAKLNEVAEDFEHADKDYEEFVNKDRERIREIYSERLRITQSLIDELNKL